jgi:hypothetical protein
MPPRGATTDEFVLLRRAALAFAFVLPRGMDVSLGLWAEFIKKNVGPEYNAAFFQAGDYLAPDDAVLLLEHLSTRLCDGAQIARTY